MGTFGTGLYSCDIAEDLRTICGEVFAVYDKDTATRLVLEEFKDIVHQGYIDNEYASFWYALADWQWKRGLLANDVRDKALELLEARAGMDEWEEDGSKNDIRKRNAVLDKLYAQLQTPPPLAKPPKIHLSKPKHKAGDIIMFQTCTAEDDEYDTLWKIKQLTPPFVYLEKQISESAYEDIDGTDRHGCYMAILCVGTVKEQYSSCIPDKFNEHSVYVWYDYCSKAQPTVADLQNCGFLPHITVDYEDFNASKYSSLEWTYKFTIQLESFKTKEKSDCKYFRKEACPSEAERFNTLLSAKKYSDDYVSPFELFHAYDSAWEESERAKISGIPIDNLLDVNLQNPKLKTPIEATKARKKWAREFCKSLKIPTE